MQLRASLGCNFRRVTDLSNSLNLQAAFNGKLTIHMARQNR
jgi:hypothetical protein